MHPASTLSEGVWKLHTPSGSRLDLLRYVHFVALRFRKRSQGIRYIGQDRFNRLLVLQTGLDHITEWRDQIEPRPLVQRGNFRGASW